MPFSRTVFNPPSFLLTFILFLSSVPVFAVVYTTRPGGGSLTDPSSFGTREIYGGKFRINGTEAEMKILASPVPSNETFSRLAGDPDKRKDLHYQKSSGGTFTGFLGTGSLARRFLITPVGSSRSCLVFVLKADPGIPSRTNQMAIPWPSHLPQLHPAQQPQLVVEHLDADFIFATVAVFGDANPDRAIANARQKLMDDGWEVEPMTEKIAADLADSGFAVLAKNSKICWLEARPGTQPNQVLITILCKKT